MEKINFENLPSTNTPINAENLNQLQTNVEDAINDNTDMLIGNKPAGNMIVDSISSKNMLNINSFINGYRFGSDGGLFADSSYSASPYIEVKPNTDYIYSRPASSGSQCICYYGNDRTFISRTMFSGNQPISITMPNNAYYVRIAELTTDLNSNLQLELGDTATTYSPYQNLNATTYVLWTNSSITSDFAGQQIILNDSLENYNYYEILFLASKHETIGLSTGKVNSFYNTSLTTLRSASGTGTISRWRDAQRTSSTKIDFSSCTACRGGATTVSTENDRIIPYKILGYK